MRGSLNPLIIGHRGASAVAPENTMAAFRKAMEVGADGIEFDVRLSRDGVAVVIHDDSLQRTGLRPEKVSDLSVNELKQIDVGSWFSKTEAQNKENQNERIPTLEELLDDFASQNAKALLYLELKSNAEQVSELVRVTCEMLQDHAARDRVIVECFDLTAIEELKQMAPDIKTAALFEPAIRNAAFLFSKNTLVERARAVNAGEIALHYKLASKRTVEAALLAGLKVVVWTVDDSGWLKRAVEFGIAALITNDPELLVKRRSQAIAI